jgi:hypothetical protein
MLILKGKNEKSRIIEYIRMGMGPMVHNSICFEYSESPVIHNSLYMEKDKFSLDEFRKSIEMYLEDESPRYIFVYTNEQESDLSDLIQWLDSFEYITIVLACR